MGTKKVTLVWYCKTENGWRRYPVVIGGNNRIKQGYVKVGQELRHYPEGHFETRSYENRRKVHKNVGDNAADAMAARDRAESLHGARTLATVAGATLVEEPTRVNLRRSALKFEEYAKERGAMESAEVNRNVTAEFLAVTGLTYADEVTREHILAFYKALRARGCAERTVANKHTRLRAFLKFCNLSKDVLPPTPKYEKKSPDSYSKDQNAAILRAADPYMSLVIQLGLKTGLRDQEIQHLEWPDINWDDATLKVTSKAHWGFKIKDSEERVLPVPKDLLKLLKAWHKANADKGDLVLSTKHGNPDGKLLRRLKRLALHAGLNCHRCDGCKGSTKECQQWTLHKLRRSYCTTLLRNGMDLATVQKFMGHADLESTIRYLEPATAAESQRVVNAIKWT